MKLRPPILSGAFVLLLVSGCDRSDHSGRADESKRTAPTAHDKAAQSDGRAVFGSAQLVEKLGGDLTWSDVPQIERSLKALDDEARRSLLKDAAKIKDAEFRSVILAAIYFQGKNGADFLKSVQDLKSDFPLGTMRLEVLRQGLTSSGLSGEAVGKFFLAIDPSEQKLLSFEVAKKIPLAELLALAKQDEMSRAPGLDDVILAAAVLRGQELRELPESAKASSIEADLKMARKLGSSPANLKTYLVSVSSSAPFQAFDVLMNPSNSDLQGQAGLLDELVSNMAEQNASETVKALADKGALTADSLRKVFGKWTASDPAEAALWLRDNKGSLEPEQKNAVCGEFVKNSIGKGDYTAARTWIDEFGSGKSAESLMGQVWQAERNAVRSQVNGNPSGTLQSIVSGQFQHADYWIEEAMGTWISKNPAQAEEWYQNNWKSLPADKSQYVAAAYANDALKQGDIATATQWIAYIQDPKTKQRIQEGINKAGANAGK